MSNIKININKEKSIGEDEPCFSIADVGANHNRDISIAKKLIYSAKDSGADAVKFQTYSAEKIYSKYVPPHSYYKKNLWELMKSIEIPRKWHKKLKKYADEVGIIFFSTPFDFEAVDELNELGVPLFKVASFEIVDLQLIEYIAKKGKPIIISTGLADMEEIQDAYKVCINAGNENIVFLQCASVYPSVPSIMNLKSMETISKAFGVLTGLSDHTKGIFIPSAAVAMGAKVIEKHFTLSRKMKGPDHRFAVEPKEFKEMISNIHDVESAIGNGRKLGPSEYEIENYKIARRSIHSKVDIKKGELITKEKLIVKRPGLGIKPKYIEMIIGRTAKTDIKKDQWIAWEMLV